MILRRTFCLHLLHTSPLLGRHIVSQELRVRTYQNRVDRERFCFRTAIELYHSFPPQSDQNRYGCRPSSSLAPEVDNFASPSSQSIMVKPKRIRKIIGSFFRRIPTLGGRIFSSKAPAPAPEPIVFPCKRTMANALSTAIVGGLNKQSYRELIREGQEMQMKTTMNLMSLMESLQSQLVVNEEPPQETDPNLFKDCLKLLSSISQACTTVKGNVIPMNRATCYQALDLRPLFERIVTYPNLFEQSGVQRNDGLTWTSRHNTARGLLIYTGKRIVRGAPGKSIEYHYNFVFEKPYPLPHDRMLSGLTSIVNVFREEFDAGPWRRANRAQIQELEQYMVHSDTIPQEPLPTAISA